MMDDKQGVEVAMGVACAEDLLEVENADEYELTVTEDSLMRLHGLSLTLPLPCDLCPIGTVFDDLDEFDAHMSEHPEAKMFACQLCSNTYKSWSNLVAHRKMFHFGKVLSCDRCGERKSHARLEGSVDYPVGSKPHGCEECEVGLDTISDVYRHYYFHRAPPGGKRRRGGNSFGATKRNRLTANVKSSGRDQGENIDTIKTESLSGTSKTSSVVNLVDSQVVDPINSLPENLNSCPGENAAVDQVEPYVENLTEIQNENEMENVNTIPCGSLTEDISGIESENSVVKPTANQVNVVSANLRNTEGSLLIKSVETFDEGLSVQHTEIQDGKPCVQTSGVSGINLSEEHSDIKIGVMPGGVEKSNGTDVSQHKSPKGTLCEIPKTNLLRKSEVQDMTASSENSELNLKEYSNILKKSDSKSKTVKQIGGLRPIAPKGGIENISGQLEDDIQHPVSGSIEFDETTVDCNHVCPHCKFSCSKLDEYRNHLISSEESHNCIMCSGSHFKKMSLTDHEYCQSHTQQFKCIPCMSILQSQEEFNSHLTEHHTASYLPCCLCGKKFNWLVYVEHIKSCQHKRIEWEFRRQLSWKTCHPCGKIFHSAGALRRHMKRHQTHQKLKYDCKTCSRTFQHGGAYAKHLWANPTHGPPERRAKIPCVSTNYICEKCGKTFSKRDGLNNHLMRHEDVKPYACTSCPKSFITRRALVVHVRQHTGERPYMCEVCGKNFTGPTSLYVHQRKHRADDGKGGGIRAAKAVKKPVVKYTCSICHKTLSSKLIFEGHMRQHTGERPFVCEVCGRGFATAKIMKIHVKRHKKNKLSKKVQKVRWVPDVSSVANKVVVNIDGNSSGPCIFLCPRCGLGLVSPNELEEHMSKGDCHSYGAEMFVLPITNDSEYIGMGSMVDIV
ncbi:zinc finger protein 62-like [Hetaerina americana]|uniref:zinc finger protein 62-like n=1 Tax=Hetaerina americana TaxID=62018 RepID=UPI003A7F5B73